MCIHRVDISDLVLLSVLLFGDTNTPICVSNAVFQDCDQICPGVQWQGYYYEYVFSISMNTFKQTSLS